LILPGSSSATRYARGMAMAFEFTGTIAAGAFLGWYLDGRFGWSPWGSIVLTVGSAGGAFVRLIQMLQRFQEIDDPSGR
jgi:F0F1-type ATP synthase assembly protein I